MIEENSPEGRPHKEMITWWKIRLFQDLSELKPIFFEYVYEQLSSVVAVGLVVLDSILSCLSDTENDSEISQGESGGGASCS